MVYRSILLAALPLMLAACTQFVDGVAVIGGQGGTIARSDALEDTIKRAKRVSPNAPATAWETVFRNEAADIVRFLDEDRVLVGAVEVGAYLGVPDFKELTLYDARSGEKIWQADRPKLRDGTYALVATDPHLVLLGTSRSALTVNAYDPRSGKQAWDVRIGTPLRQAISADGRRLFLVSGEGRSAVTAQALDLHSGARVWSQTLPAETIGKDRDLRLALDGDELYLVGASVLRLSADDGNVAWSVPASTERASELWPTSQGLLVWSGRSMMLLDRHDGRARWRHAVEDGPIKLGTVAEAAAIRLIGMDTERAAAALGSDRLQSVDLASGAVRWSRTLNGTAVSQLAVEQQMILVSLEDDVAAFRLADGEPAYRTSYPVAFRMASPTEYDSGAQADVLHVREGKLYVSRESAGVAAFSLGDGAALWQQPLNVATVTAYPFSRPARLVRMNTALAANKVKLPKPAAGANTFRVAQRSFEAEQFRARMRSLEFKQAEARRRGDRFAERLAIQEQIVALHTNARFAAIQANLDLASDILDMNLALISALDRTAVEGAISRWSSEVEHAVRLHQGAFQGRYFVRPFQFPGEAGTQGITLVDLDTGARSDVVTSPFVPIVTSQSAELPQAALSPSGERLVTVGVGLNPGRYEEYVAWKIRQARPSVLAYDVRSLTLAPRNEALEQRIANLRALPAPMQLAYSAKTGNLPKVKRLLDSGVDVNGRDARGYTALMMAAEGGREGVVRLLLEKGAGVNLAGNGRTALDVATEPSVQKLLQDMGAKKSAQLF